MSGSYASQRHQPKATSTAATTSEVAQNKVHDDLGTDHNDPSTYDHNYRGTDNDHTGTCHNHPRPKETTYSAA